MSVGKRIRLGDTSFLVDAIEDEIVTVRDEGAHEMTLSVPKILLGVR